MKTQERNNDNIIPFPGTNARVSNMPDPAKVPSPLRGQSHGWTKEAAEAYGTKDDEDYRSENSMAHSRSEMADLQKAFDDEMAAISATWGESSGGDIERRNLAQEYSCHTDDIGNYLIDGVGDYCDKSGYDNYEGYGY